MNQNLNLGNFILRNLSLNQDMLCSDLELPIAGQGMSFRCAEDLLLSVLERTVTSMCHANVFICVYVYYDVKTVGKENDGPQKMLMT